jgi:hypothetical protein
MGELLEILTTAGVIVLVLVIVGIIGTIVDRVHTDGRHTHHTMHRTYIEPRRGD